MNEIKSLADQIKSRMAKPDTPEKTSKSAKRKEVLPPEIPEILERLRELDVTNNKTLIHARVDEQTAKMIHHLKIASGIEVSRLICFSINRLFCDYPELKTIIREHLENFKL